MIVWLWDACGPARSGRGVTDDDARARQTAEACTRGSQASAARAESARTILASGTLTFAYERTGEGWAAQRHRDGRITWTAFTAPLPEPAPS